MLKKIDSHSLIINNTRIHYLECGKDGDPIVFLHGLPTASCLWRHILPGVSNVGHCLAMDLVGCGQSEQPDIDYSIEQHIEFFSRFIESLQLSNITLVLHAWGSVIGLDYAMKNPDKIKGLVFYESHIRPTMDWDMLSLPVKQILSVLNDNTLGQDTILHSNYFMDSIFPLGFMKKLADEDFLRYKKPFDSDRGRKIIWQYLRDLPTGENTRGSIELIAAYSEKLQKSPIPKLMLYAMPGFITTMETVQWAKEFLPHLTLIEIDEALHYAQETCPEKMVDAIVGWYEDLP